jgi:hypothetical protein
MRIPGVHFSLLETSILSKIALLGPLALYPVLSYFFLGISSSSNKIPDSSS